MLQIRFLDPLPKKVTLVTKIIDIDLNISKYLTYLYSFNGVQA